jgi:hypothetical protein
MVIDRLLVGHIGASTPSAIALILLLVGRVPCLSLRKRSIAYVLASVSLVGMETKEVIYLLLLIVRSSNFHVGLLEVALLHVTNHCSFLLHRVLLRTNSRLRRGRISVQVSSVRIRIPISRRCSRPTSLRLRSRVLATCKDHFAASSRATLALKLSTLAGVISARSLFLLSGL